MNIIVVADEIDETPTLIKGYITDQSITIPPLENNYRSVFELIATTNLALSVLGEVEIHLIDVNIGPEFTNLELFIEGEANSVKIEWIGDVELNKVIKVQIPTITFKVKGPPGPKGPRGNSGPRGPKGPKGNTGRPKYNVEKLGLNAATNYTTSYK